MPPTAPTATLRRPSRYNPYQGPTPPRSPAPPMPSAYNPAAATIAPPRPTPTTPTTAPAAPRPAAMPAPAAATGMPSPYTPPRATGPYADSINAFQDAQNRANQANESRYQDVLHTLEGQGESAKSDIARGGQSERADITQDAIGRGIYSTSVLDSLRGESRGREARQSAAVDESVAGQRAGVMERRTDAGPDAGFYANLINQQAAAAAGSRPGTVTYGAGGSGGGSDPFGGLAGGGRGGGGGQEMSRGPTFGQHGGGGVSGSPGSGMYGGSGVQTYSGAPGPGAQTFNPDGTPRISTHYNPAGGSNIYLGEHGSVTGGTPAGGGGSGAAPLTDLSDPAYWEQHGFHGVEARNMAQRYRH